MPWKGTSEKPEFVESSPNNFGRGGFESVSATLTANNQTFKAYVKVAHPAQALVVSTHGNHDGSLRLIFSSTANAMAADLGQPGGGQQIYNSFTVGPTSSNVPTSAKTIVFLSCGPLDLRDYNNFYTAPFVKNDAQFSPEYHRPDADLAARKLFGGELWYNATRTSGANLLGYDAVSPIRGTVAAAARFKQMLQTMPVPVAWLKANVFTHVDSQFWLACNACAFWGSDYYFVEYPVPQIANLEIKLKRPIDAKDIHLWKIPQANWDTVPDTWDKPIIGKIGDPIP